jgi:hypothetical protein
MRCYPTQRRPAGKEKKMNKEKKILRAQSPSAFIS